MMNTYIFFNSLAILNLFVSSSIASDKEEHDELSLWKAENGRVYFQSEEELERMSNLKSNKLYIEEHNRYSDLFGFTLKMNQFSDMTSYEFLQITTSIGGSIEEPEHDDEGKDDDNKDDDNKDDDNKDDDNKDDDNKDDDNKDDDDDDQDSDSNEGDPSCIWNTIGGYFSLPHHFNKSKLPASVDWREEGVVTPIKDQGFCNSAYAFTVTGAIEGAYAVSTGILEPLSDQNIVDCSVVYGNKGCKGGDREAALMYILDNDGIDKEKAYPYIASQDTCRFSVDGIGAIIRGMVKIKKGNVSNLQAAVALVGPITTSIDHQHNAFRFYSSGIFSTRKCSNKKLTHEMLIVGYGKENGTSYWLLKNSWGPNWGISGYMKMAKGNRNHCGIATKAIFPKL